MQDLKVLDVYTSADGNEVDSFNASIQSEYNIASNYERAEADFAWLDLMEDTIVYLDNILRNPNRFIINEEEIVNVEQARRITVESIKHLSKHTNYIQEIQDNGDVRPSKILNINKEESYNTYENRLIYTLINNMRLFIDMKERTLVSSSYLKDDKKCEYSAVSKVGIERVSVNMVINTRTNYNKEDGVRNGMSVQQRIEKLKYRISDLTNMQVYVALAKEHVAKVVPPIKKTNLILKNTNFQYAMKLWDYLQGYVKDDSGVIKEKRVIENDLNMKQMLDDIFLLDYLTIKSIDTRSNIDSEAKEEAIEELTNKMIDKIVEINTELPIEKIQEMIGDKLAIIKSKKEASLAEIENKFNDRIKAFTERITDFSFR